MSTATLTTEGSFAGDARPRSRSILSPLRGAWQRWRLYRETSAALHGLSEHNLRDVGLTRDGIKQAARRAARSA